MARPTGTARQIIEIGDRLRKAREALGFSQSELAGMLGVRSNTWNQWKQGKHLPDPLVIGRLKFALSRWCGGGSCGERGGEDDDRFREGLASRGATLQRRSRSLGDVGRTANHRRRSEFEGKRTTVERRERVQQAAVGQSLAQ
jgi:transcriptional regulator with XRE-family HTH domain